MYNDGPTRESVKVGWLLGTDKGGVMYKPPARVRSVEMSRTHAKSASRCPAIMNLESRYFEIACPFDLSLKFDRTEEGVPALVNLLGDESPVRWNHLSKLLSLIPEAEWRYPDRPTLQLALPYIFIADEPVYLSQLAPFMHYRSDALPGTIFGGRFPVHVWPRAVVWAFEWHDTSRPINLKRGEPLFYVQFETEPQDRAVQMVEAERTEELSEYLEMITGAVNFVNQTFSLFRDAEERRPEQLLFPKPGRKKIRPA
ncbi:MAG: hypothetical protein ABJM43_13130 [Paracoccaceae bacterium]